MEHEHCIASEANHALVCPENLKENQKISSDQEGESRSQITTKSHGYTTPEKDREENASINYHENKTKSHGNSPNDTHKSSKWEKKIDSIIEKTGKNIQTSNLEKSEDSQSMKSNHDEKQEHAYFFNLLEHSGKKNDSAYDEHVSETGEKTYTLCDHIPEITVRRETHSKRRCSIRLKSSFEKKEYSPHITGATSINKRAQKYNVKVEAGDDTNILKQVESADMQSERRKVKSYKDYTRYLKLLSKMDWNLLDPRIYNSSPLCNPPMTKTAFWFMVCSEYFERNDNFPQKIRDAKIQLFDSQLKSSSIQKVKQGRTYIESDQLLDNLKADSEESEEFTNELPSIDYTKVNRLAKELTSSNRNIREIGSYNVEVQNRKSYELEDDQFLNTTRNILLKRSGASDRENINDLEKYFASRKLPLESIIGWLENDLANIKESNKQRFTTLETGIYESLKAEECFNQTYCKDDILKDLHCRFDSEKRFLNYLEDLQHSNTKSGIQRVVAQCEGTHQQARTTQNKSKDYICKVCSDGDYSEDNEIVICDRCNISVHQKCFVMKEIPKGNWICDLCIAYGPNGIHMQCPLCWKRGGVMRRCNIESYSEFWKTKNPDYAKLMAKASNDPERIDGVQYEDQSEIIGEDCVSITSKNYKEYLYYDYYEEETKTHRISDANLPRPKMAWVHLSCIFWHPELCLQGIASPKDKSLEDESSYPPHLEISGFGTLDKKRFNLPCQVCGTKNGACIQCAKGKCQASFHVECARVANIFLEVIGYENPKFFIYCERHAPLKIKRTLEHNWKTEQEEIAKFCRAIEKYYSSVRYKQGVNSPDLSTKSAKKDRKKRMGGKGQSARDEFLRKLSQHRFMREVKYELNKFQEYGSIVVLKKHLIEQPDGVLNREYSFEEFSEPKKEFLKTKIPKCHKVWSRVARERGWKIASVKSKFKRLLSGAVEDHMFGLERDRVEGKKSIAKKQKLEQALIRMQQIKEVSFIPNNSEGTISLTQKEFTEELYCTCQKVWKGELLVGIPPKKLMFLECELCNEWFHPPCIGIEETDEVKLNLMKIKCIKCKEEEDDSLLGKRGPFLIEEFRETEVISSPKVASIAQPYEPIKRLKSGKKKIATLSNIVEVDSVSKESKEDKSDNEGSRDGGRLDHYFKVVS